MQFIYRTVLVKLCSVVSIMCDFVSLFSLWAELWTLFDKALVWHSLRHPVYHCIYKSTKSCIVGRRLGNFVSLFTCVLGTWRNSREKRIFRGAKKTTIHSGSHFYYILSLKMLLIWMKRLYINILIEFIPKSFHIFRLASHVGLGFHSV